MEVSTLLSLPEGLHVEWIEPQGADLSIGVVSLLTTYCFPLCSQASSQVHSQYQRTLRDVPCGGRKVILRLSVRKFFCRNPDCSRKIFTERLPTFVQPHAQVTTRLFEAVQAIGLATSGELGTRLADRIAMHTSPTTILRRIMALAPCFTPPVSCLGIDDWSFRRGRTFGTILVDLTTHTILDLLPFNHWSGRLHATRLQLPSPTHYQCIETRGQPPRRGGGGIDRLVGGGGARVSMHW
jgi:transposase